MPASPSSTDPVHKSTHGLSLDVPSDRIKRNTSTVSLPSMGSKSTPGRETLRKRVSASRIVKRQSSAGSTVPGSEKSTPDRTSRASSEDDVPDEVLLEYLEYRKKNNQTAGSKAQHKTWPDHVENAFMMALAEIPKLGRRKKPVGGKLCGRNELISAYILKHTGEVRCRKQVSSHIQVLKGKLKFCPEFMERVSNIPKHSDEKPHHTLGSSIDSPGSSYSDDRSPGVYDHHYSLRSHHGIPNFAPRDLQVWIGPEETHGAQPTHVITKLVDSYHRDTIPLGQLKNFESRFPCVVEHMRMSPVGLNIPIVHLECSIAKPPPLHQDNLFIHSTFQFMTSGIPLRTRLRCSTTVLASGNTIVQELSDLVISENMEGVQFVVLPFPSELWSDFLRIGGSNVVDPSLAPGSRAPASLEEISITQEVFAEGLGPHPVLMGIYIWEISEAHYTSEGSVVWSSIIPTLEEFPAPPPVWGMSPQPNTSHPQTISPSQLIYQQQPDNGYYTAGYMAPKQEPLEHPIHMDRAAGVFFSAAPESHGYPAVMGGEGHEGHSMGGQHWEHSLVHQTDNLDIC